MRWIRVTLTQTNVAQQISGPGGLTVLTSKFKNLLFFVIYPEDVNNVDATNGPARIGDSTVQRVVASGSKGIPLLPGIINSAIAPPVGQHAPYSLETLFIMGQTGDVFQIGYVMP